MTKKRWCGALLTLALVLTLLPTAAFAADGTGAAGAPILIGSVEELKDFRDRVNNGDISLCAKLTDDIVLNDGTFDADGNYTLGASGKDAEQWTPIGNLGNEYSGTFDGGGHTIKGLYINSKYGNVGLFASTENAIIKNLTVTGYVRGKSAVGGIVGGANGSSIQNCVNYSNVTGDGSAVGGLVGIVLGGVSSIIIQNCINCGNVTGSKHVGGLVGHCGQNSIQNCANLGGVKGTCTAADDDAYTGGIVGYAVHSVTMTACYNIGKVEGDKYVGGLVGWANNPSGSTASNCYYLNDTANAFGNTNYSDGDTTGWKKSIGDFTKNEGVLRLLRGSSTESPWADTCKTVTVGNTSMTLPWFAHPGNDHDWSTWQHQTATHTRKCQNSGCDATITENCSGGTATCTAAAVCTVCDGSYGSINEANHSDLQHVPAVAATTSAEGNIEYWHCPDCGKYFKNAAATQEITQADTVIARLPGSTPYYPPSYAITVEKAEHGSVTVSPKSAAAGATVTVTVTPDEGYTLETLTVTDKNGNELTLTDKGDGKYTFTMPSGSVTVKATFMDDNTMLNFFVDVKPGDYFYDAVLWAAQKGITSGTDAVHFSPNLPCTRAQIVTFLWRAAGSPVVNYAMDMTDVPEGSYYAEAVRWALSLGSTTGTGADAFSPDAPCTRAQAVTFLARARNAKASGGMAVREFEDFDRIPAYAVDAIQWALENNVTTGTSDTTFSPDEVCTRAQIVTFLYRAFS